MRNRTYYYAGREKKKKHIGAVLVLLLAAGGLLGFWSFFRIQEVGVVGSTHYSEEQIKKIVLRGPLAGNSVLAPLLCSRDRTEEISFIDAIDVSYVNPHEVLISIKEKQSIGCVRYLDCYVYFDREGVVIESTVEKDGEVPYYEGMEPGSVCIDQPLAVRSSQFLDTAVNLFQIFQTGVADPDRIRIDGKSALTLFYGEIQVMLGKDKYLDDKMARVDAILPMLEGKKGTLHMENITSERKTVTFENADGSVRKN